MTRAQLDPSAHAPWASTTLTSLVAIVLLLISQPAWPSSVQRCHPVRDGPPDLVRRILLDVMAPRDRHLGQRWEPADECEILLVGEDRAGLSPKEQLGHTAR